MTNNSIVAEATETLNLLVVDDKEDWVKSHEERFKRFGFNVIPGVYTRMDAMKMLQESKHNEKIDVVLLDLIMDAEKFDDVTVEQLDQEIEEGYYHLTEGERLLDMLMGQHYKDIGSPIFIIYTTSQSHNHLMKKYPKMVGGILSKSVVDEEEIKDIVRKAIRKKWPYFDFE